MRGSCLWPALHGVAGIGHLCRALNAHVDPGGKHKKHTRSAATEGVGWERDYEAAQGADDFLQDYQPTWLLDDVIHTEQLAGLSLDQIQLLVNATVAGVSLRIVQLSQRGHYTAVQP